MLVLRVFLFVAMIAGHVLLAGCATIVSGTTQSIYIETPQANGASCVLKDSQGGGWFLDKTPGFVTVKRGDGPLHVMCKKTGYHDGKAKAGERAQPSLLSNIFNGMIVGSLVDVASGAAETYPDSITVLLQPREFTSDEQRRKWYEMQETSKGFGEGKTLVF